MAIVGPDGAPVIVGDDPDEIPLEGATSALFPRRVGILFDAPVGEHELHVQVFIARIRSAMLTCAVEPRLT